MFTPENMITVMGVIFASDWVGRIILHGIERKEKKEERERAFNQEEFANTLTLLKTGVCALLKNEIVIAHRTYTEMGYCSLADRNNINDISTAYGALRSDPITQKLTSEVLELPMEQPKGDKNK